MAPTKLKSTHETLTIDFTGFHSNGADLFIAWADTHLAVPFQVDTDTKVRQQIDEKVRNAKGEISARTYFDRGHVPDRQGRKPGGGRGVDGPSRRQAPTPSG